MHRGDRQLHRARRLARRYRTGAPYPPPPGASITNRSPAATVTESHPRTLPKHRLDCPDPGALATFYGAMMDWKADISSDWAEVRAEYGQCICFQQAEAYTLPR